MADPDDEQDRELGGDDRRRNLFGTTWFRALIVVIVLGVMAVVAVPYVLDWVNPPAAPVAVVKPLPATPPRPAPATPAAPPPAPALGAKAETPAKPAAPAPMATSKAAETMARAEAPAKAPAAKKSEPTKAETPRAEPAKRPAPAKAAASAPSAAGGTYWVQVGAFKDPDTAKRLAERLRAQNYRVSETSTQVQAGVTGGGSTGGGAAAGAAAPASGADRYDVLVSGPSGSELNAKLSARGLAGSPSASGVVIKPSLPLRDAVTLSKDLAAEGFKVQVRRAGAAPGPAERPAPAVGADALYRVRVGGFPDRASAAAVVGELEAKGYKPFIARGRE